MARGRRGLLAATLAACILGALPAGAAAQRYADAESTDVTGACTEAAPCRLDWAIEGAVADDIVILDDDTYTVDHRINPSVPVHVQGQPDEGRPKLVGSWNALDSAPAVLELLHGGSLSHLTIETRDVMQAGVHLADVTAEDLIVCSKGGGEAVNLLGGSSGTLLRDSVVISTMAGIAAVGIDDGPSGVEAVDLRNVTAVASGVGAVGIDSRVVQSDVTMLNVIARGGLGANDVQGQDPKLSVGHSNVRPEASNGFTDLGGNQSGDPLFVNAEDGDFRTYEDSPTIDAGVDDPLNGSRDPDGLPRGHGEGPNIGAYEQAVVRKVDVEAPPADDTKPEPQLPRPKPEPTPELGVNVVGGVESGRVVFKPAGSSEFVQLADPASIPVGSLIDARRGSVRLRSASDANGRSQVGVFSGAMFRVRQGRSPGAYTELRLAGGNFESCGRGAAGRGAAVASRARSVRRLWSRSRRGRFRTRGRHGTATVRGTMWSTADRCDGTMVRVRRGLVAVRDLRKGRSVLVRKGESYLARRR